jgi:PTH1 family peptidyl-tRNA hydrolase
MALDTVIVGLGNPGPRYERTRHNAGFLFVDQLAAAHGIPLRQQKHQAVIGEGPLCGSRCLLAKPQTFMNRSGESVQRILSFTGVAPASLVVVHDDMDLPFGRLRLRRGGGAGGHRGIASILDHLGTPEFIRIRVGVGRPAEGLPAEVYVLQEFGAAELRQLREVNERACAATELLLREGLEKAMSLFNAAAPGA